MRELINFFKELFLLKQEDRKIVGLTSLKKTPAPVPKVPAKKQQKELPLSELMRRNKPANHTGSIRPANPSRVF